MEQCDFHLTQEKIRNKFDKLIYIYLNSNKNNDNIKRTIKKFIIWKIWWNNSKSSKNIKENELLLFQRENIDNMIVMQEMKY